MNSLEFGLSTTSVETVALEKSMNTDPSSKPANPRTFSPIGTMILKEPVTSFDLKVCKTPSSVVATWHVYN
jgi:hypothetical protein